MRLNHASVYGAALIALSTAVACGTPAPEESPPRAHTSSSGTGGSAPATKDYPASNACTVVPQAGCDPDHTCVIATADGATLCEGAGTAPLGGACGSDGDCAVGLTCVGSACHAFCEQPSDCKGPIAACTAVYHDMKPVPGWQTCALQCNPGDPQNTGGIAGIIGCPSGLTCFALSSDVGPQGSTECYPAGPGAAGASCTSSNDCGVGLICLTNQGSSSCTKMCLLGLGQCNCASFGQPQHVELPSGMMEVGYCQ